MRPRKFPGYNHVFEHPQGNEDNSLFVETIVDSLGNPAYRSVWTLTDEEREQIANGGTIDLVVTGLNHPPVAMWVGEPLGTKEVR